MRHTTLILACIVYTVTSSPHHHYHLHEHVLPKRHLGPISTLISNTAGKILNPLGIGQTNSGSSAQSQSFSLGGSLGLLDCLSNDTPRYWVVKCNVVEPYQEPPPRPKWKQIWVPVDDYGISGSLSTSAANAQSSGGGGGGAFASSGSQAQSSSGSNGGGYGGGLSNAGSQASSSASAGASGGSNGYGIAPGHNNGFSGSNSLSQAQSSAQSSANSGVNNNFIQGPPQQPYNPQPLSYSNSGSQSNSQSLSQNQNQPQYVIVVKPYQHEKPKRKPSRHHHHHSYNEGYGQQSTQLTAQGGYNTPVVPSGGNSGSFSNANSQSASGSYGAGGQVNTPIQKPFQYGDTNEGYGQGSGLVTSQGGYGSPVVPSGGNSGSFSNSNSQSQSASGGYGGGAVTVPIKKPSHHGGSNNAYNEGYAQESGLVTSLGGYGNPVAPVGGNSGSFSNSNSQSASGSYGGGVVNTPVVKPSHHGGSNNAYNEGYGQESGLVTSQGGYGNPVVPSGGNSGSFSNANSQSQSSSNSIAGSNGYNQGQYVQPVPAPAPVPVFPVGGGYGGSSTNSHDVGYGGSHVQEPSYIGGGQSQSAANSQSQSGSSGGSGSQSQASSGSNSYSGNGSSGSSSYASSSSKSYGDRLVFH